MISFEAIFLVAIVFVVLIIFAAVVFKKAPRKLNTKYFQEQWQALQGLCANKETWPLAIINADKLVDEALKKRQYKGNTMGERLISARKALTNNDAIWHAHKLRNRIAHENNTSIRQQDVRNALTGFRQALKDLGAI